LSLLISRARAPPPRQIRALQSELEAQEASSAAEKARLNAERDAELARLADERAVLEQMKVRLSLRVCRSCAQPGQSSSSSSIRMMNWLNCAPQQNNN
jgi:hypothetical protein